ncbi:transmembrane amino acid transporter protein-domain-containing protein [Mariannaea sp. PMI_226]|nr:transmembrane amino acid transporter protein-domain-containing protein [Mariannaea sp. PMI_226]
MPQATRKPSNWDEYDGRPSPTAGGSMTSSFLPDDQAIADDDDDNDDNDAGHAQGLGAFVNRRRSSVTNHLAAIADIGGVNSFRSFARSWQRAAAFPEVIPRRHSFVFTSDQDVDDEYSRDQFEASTSHPETSLLRQRFEAFGDGPSTTNHEASLGLRRGSFRDRENKPLLDPEMAGALPVGSLSSRSSIFAVPPHLATPSIVGSYGSQYGTIDGTVRRRISIGHGAAWVDEDVEDGEGAAHGELQPILVKEVKQGDKVVLAVEGQSTLPQSVFNSINAIIGVGLLSLPLAFRMAGWIPGLLILTLTAATTSHTGKLLAKCMDYDPSLITYSDLAYVSFGTRARVIVSALFTLELISATVALVILFADSLNLLLPGFASVNIWKTVAGGLILVLNAMPLRLLSYTSVVGIISTFCIVCIVVIDGFLKPDTPGSLREPAVTHLLPENWLAVPLAYGLLASPWGAHSVFPSIYRDMRHPYKWKKAVDITFGFSYVLDTSLAIIGLLMFGDEILETITSNILKSSGYPEGLTIVMCIFVAIIPLTKIPLNARPIITTLDVIFGVHQDQLQHHGQASSGTSAVTTQATRAVIRVLVALSLLAISIAIPGFDSVCAFLGAALCTLISVILPISFHLKLFWHEIPLRERLVSFLLLVIFGVFGVVGTIWTFLPKHLIGAD